MLPRYFTAHNTALKWGLGVGVRRPDTGIHALLLVTACCCKDLSLFLTVLNLKK